MKTKKIISFAMINVMVVFFAFTALAQQSNMNYDEIEKKQDAIEGLYVDIYKIINTYPGVTYNYVYEDGEVTEVIVEGIPDNRDKKQLEVYLIDLNKIKQEISNVANRVGVFYATETEPKPEMGYVDFYNNLYGSISYPESATDNGVEGTVFVKFVVDAEGNVENIIASEDIEAPGEWIVNDMKEEAKTAVKATSGAWEPAKIGGISTAQWVVLPVQFKLKDQPFSRSF